VLASLTGVLECIAVDPSVLSRSAGVHAAAVYATFGIPALAILTCRVSGVEGPRLYARLGDTKACVPDQCELTRPRWPERPGQTGTGQSHHTMGR
jgi:hypothetical protein